MWTKEASLLQIMVLFTCLFENTMRVQYYIHPHILVVSSFECEHCFSLTCIYYQFESNHWFINLFDPNSCLVCWFIRECILQYYIHILVQWYSPPPRRGKYPPVQRRHAPNISVFKLFFIVFIVILLSLGHVYTPPKNCLYPPILNS